MDEYVEEERRTAAAEALKLRIEKNKKETAAKKQNDFQVPITPDDYKLEIMAKKRLPKDILFLQTEIMPQIERQSRNLTPNPCYDEATKIVKLLGNLEKEQSVKDIQLAINEIKNYISRISFEDKDNSYPKLYSCSIQVGSMYHSLCLLTLKKDGQYFLNIIQRLFNLLIEIFEIMEKTDIQGKGVTDPIDEEQQLNRKRLRQEIEERRIRAEEDSLRMSQEQLSAIEVEQVQRKRRLEQFLSAHEVQVNYILTDRQNRMEENDKMLEANRKHFFEMFLQTVEERRKAAIEYWLQSKRKT